MASEFHSWIEAYRVSPPVGRVLAFAAKAHVVGPQEQQTLPECLGRTEEEAKAKAQAALDEWLSKQP
jgi:hypothetical protein